MTPEERANLDEARHGAPQRQASGRPATTDADPPSRPVLDTAEAIGGGALDFAGAAAKGAAKEIFDPRQGSGSFAPNPNPSGLAKWAGTDDPEHPVAEGLGRAGADIAPTALLPETALGRGLPYVGKGINWLANVPGRGAVGGALESRDRSEGAATGAASAVAANIGLGALHRSLPALAALWAIAAGHHGFWPYYHLLHTAGEPLARGAARVAPPVAGAAAAKAEDAVSGDDQ